MIRAHLLSKPCHISSALYSTLCVFLCGAYRSEDNTKTEYAIQVLDGLGHYLTFFYSVGLMFMVTLHVKILPPPRLTPRSLDHDHACHLSTVMAVLYLTMRVNGRKTVGEVAFNMSTHCALTSVPPSMEHTIAVGTITVPKS
jgi:hypothetical protein